MILKILTRSPDISGAKLYSTLFGPPSTHGADPADDVGLDESLERGMKVKRLRSFDLSEPSLSDMYEGGAMVDSEPPEGTRCPASKN